MEDLLLIIGLLVASPFILYRCVFEDYSDHPIWNTIFVIPMFYLMPLLLIALGFEGDFWIFGIIGLIQAIAHVIIVIKGYGDLFISKITVFVITSIATMFRVYAILLFVAIIKNLIEIIPRTETSVIESVLRFFR